jgi:CheY-like chemotaxis protein
MGSPENRALLLVEDDSNDALFMKTAFEAVGLQNPLHEVSDGKQALAYLEGTGKYTDRKQYPLPYLILLDLKLPYVMGLGLLKWIRERPEFDSTIVLVLTASDSASDVDEAYRLGANGYLVKTSRFDSLQTLAQAIKDFWITYNRAGSAFGEQD